MGRGFQPGDRVGPYNILLLEKDHKNNRGEWYSWFLCPHCEKEKFLSSHRHVSAGDTHSCGCIKENLVGKKFGHWTVLEKTDQRTSDRKILWKCICDCGNKEIYLINTSDLKLGRSQSCGCIQSRGEEKIGIFLSKNNINFQKEYSFNNCINPSTKARLRFDFYLPKYNCLIEYDGEQHFKKTNFSHEDFKDRQKRDNIKNQYCKDNNIKLIRIPYTEFDNIEEILTKELNL